MAHLIFTSRGGKGIVVFNTRNSTKLTREVFGEIRGGVQKAAPLCLFWTIFNKINDRSFDNQESLIKSSKCSFCTLFCCAQRDPWMCIPCSICLVHLTAVFILIGAANITLFLVSKYQNNLKRKKNKTKKG